MGLQLESAEKSQGAVFASFGGVELPAHFNDWQAEWAAVRQRCGLLDGRFRALLRMLGSDRVTFLQGMVTNDVAKLQEGEGTYAALLTQQGKVVSDLRIYALADELWLDVPATRAAAVQESLERFIVADDVEFANQEAWAALVAVEGPHAARVLIGVIGESVDTAKPYAHREVSFDGSRLRVVAASHGGETGYVLFGSPDAGGSLWEHCRAAGADPVGMDALNVLRVEAGIPWHGHDMDESTLISEVGLETAISFTKGCYLGQEVVERVAARGQVHRTLAGLACDGRTAPAAGTELTRDGKAVGWITSAVWSPMRNGVIALGYVRRECSEVGSELRLAAPSDSVVRVVPLPFYVRQAA